MTINERVSDCQSQMTKALPKKFFTQPTRRVAKELLGAYLMHETKGGPIVGRIVETEAYLPKNDPGCHAHKGQTKRNAPMFGAPGHSYVYLCYGMYDLFNVVTEAEGCGAAVLIRALEPVSGIELMQRRRKMKNLQQLTNGPGKLVKALGIHRGQNSLCLRSSDLKILPPNSFPDFKPAEPRFSIVQTTRIGLSLGADLPLRYYIKGNPFISKS